MKWPVMIMAMVIFAGCNHSSIIIIPVNRMTGVMWDVIQVDEFTSGYLTKDSSKNIKLERMKMYRQVFTLHHVSEEDYFASFKYYTGKPGLFKVMIDSLSEKATREQRNIHIPVKAPLK